MNQRARTDEAVVETIQGEKLEPIGSVRRELTRPDGTRVVVEVPVYPPFRLAERPSSRKPARSRSAPSLKRKQRIGPAPGAEEDTG